MKFFASFLLFICTILSAQESQVLEKAILFSENGFQNLEFNGIRLVKGKVKGKIAKIKPEKFLKKNHIISDHSENSIQMLYLSADSLAIEVISKSKNSDINFINRVYLSQLDDKKLNFYRTNTIDKVDNWQEMEKMYWADFQNFNFDKDQTFINLDEDQNQLVFNQRFEKLNAKKFTNIGPDYVYMTNENKTPIQIHWTKHGNKKLAIDYITTMLELNKSNVENAVVVSDTLDLFGEKRNYYTVRSKENMQGKSLPIHTNQLYLVEEDNQIMVVSIINHQ